MRKRTPFYAETRAVFFHRIKRRSYCCSVKRSLQHCFLFQTLNAIFSACVSCFLGDCLCCCPGGTKSCRPDPFVRPDEGLRRKDGGSNNAPKNRLRAVPPTDSRGAPAVKKACDWGGGGALLTSRGLILAPPVRSRTFRVSPSPLWGEECV